MWERVKSIPFNPETAQYKITPKISHLILLTICANHFNLRFIEAECKVVCQSQTFLLLLTHPNVLQSTHPGVYTLVTVA